jgi:hypothetical protein
MNYIAVIKFDAHLNLVIVNPTQKAFMKKGNREGDLGTIYSICLVLISLWYRVVQFNGSFGLSVGWGLRTMSPLFFGSSYSQSSSWAITS